MGASIFLTCDFYRLVGPMSEKYFLYYEELDWAKRMPHHLRLSTCLDAIVFHKEGSSIGTSSLSRPSNTSIYYSSASALRFYWEHERIMSPIALARILYNMPSYFLKGDFDALSVISHAIKDVIVGRRRCGSYGSEEFLKSSRKQK
jgi:GT2 family glycosyltransferase